MKTGLQDIVSIIAEHTGTNRGRVAHIARRGQEAGIFPKAVGSHIPRCGMAHVVALLLAVASGRPERELSDAWHIGSFKSTEPGNRKTAGEYLSGMLASFRDMDPADTSDQAKLAFKSSVTVVGGDNPAVVVRFATTEDPIEISFTPTGGEFEPYWSETLARATVLPGRLLFRIGVDLADVSPFADVN